MTTYGHVFVMGGTQSGKTHWANELHATFPGPSVFFNANMIHYIVGARCSSAAGVTRAMVQDQHVNLRSSSLEDLVDVVAWLKRHGARHRQGGPPWAQLVVDEAQKYSRQQAVGGQPDPVQDIATTGLGAFGIRLVCVTQYPATLNTTTRTNCETRIIFRPGIEGERFLQSSGRYPFDDIIAWTSQRRHFASYHPDLGWRYHGPRPRRPEAASRESGMTEGA